MHALTPAVAAWLATHHAVVTLGDLRRFGVTDHQIRRLLRLRTLVAYTRGVYRLAAAPRTAEQPMALACAVHPRAIVSHVSAGRVWALRGLGADRRLHVMLPGRVQREVPGAVVHWSHRIDPVDVVERPDGIRVTSPPRTAFDLAWRLSDDRLESVIEQLLHEQMCTIPTLFATGRRLGASGRNGSARFARVLQSRPAWLRPVASDLELRFERALRAAGLPRPRRQPAVTLPNGTDVHPDFLWPDLGEAIEIDHITWHGGKLDLTYDKQRDRLLRRVGIHVTRVTDREIDDDLRAVIEDVRAILERSRALNVS
jgi:very-short-patch-repair endonuclease